MADERIIAEYLVETPLALEAAAESMAGEQSTGTFTRVPGETDALARAIRGPSRVDRSAGATARAVAARRGEAARRRTDCYQRGRVRISFPLENIGPNLPTIISTVAGNLFELRQLSGLRLLGPRISRIAGGAIFLGRSSASPARGGSRACTIGRSSARSSSRASA